MVKLIPSSFAPLLLIIVLHLTLSPATDAELKVRASNCNSTDGNYTSTSAYKTNLDALFSKTTTKNLRSGFYNFSAGHSPNKANLISLCYGSANVSGCHACQSFLIDRMRNLCPNQKTAIAWSDDCFVRYSKHSIFATLAESPDYYLLRGVKATDEYSDVVNTLLEGIPGNASAGGSRIKFASAQADLNSSVTIYAAGQCTPDLSRKECLNCLNDASNFIQTCTNCKGQRGARILNPSCMVRFEDYKFYQSSGVPAPSTSPSLAPVPSQSPNLAPVPSPSPSLEPVPSPGPSLEPVLSTSPSPSLESGPSPSQSLAPVPPASPSPSVGVNTSAVAPSGNSTVNAAKESIGRRSSISIVAIGVVGACFAGLL